MITAVKICGIRDPKIAIQAIGLGAEYVGIMCYTQSPRYVNPDLGKEIADAVKSVGGTPVAVFVDNDAESMLSLCEHMGVDCVQLHGSAARRSHHQLPEHFQRIYVLSVDQDGQIQEDLDQGFSSLDASRDSLMYDNVQGGSGRRFNLNTFANPYPLPFFLAGGLTADNVSCAIAMVHPFAVDVSSGVESSPGVKDVGKIKAFIEAAHGATD